MSLEGHSQWSQTGNDTSEEPCQCASQTPEDVASATVISCDHQVQAREGHAAHRYTEQMPLMARVYWDFSSLQMKACY